jgi:hypothetical protein
VTTDPTSSLCPFCREPVKPDARKCPHCHQWQGRSAAFFYHPAVLIAFVLLPMMAFFALPGRNILPQGENFAASRDQLVIVQSGMHHSAGDEKCGPSISVIGTIRNESNIGWKDVYLEAQYFDGSGTLIDTIGQEQYGLVVPPHEEVAFRIRGTAARGEKEYASHKVFVRSARDARSLL